MAQFNRHPFTLPIKAVCCNKNQLPTVCTEGVSTNCEKCFAANDNNRELTIKFIKEAYPEQVHQVTSDDGSEFKNV